MKSVIALLLTATPALAHSGAHLHPHGGGSWLTMVTILAVAATGAAVAGRHVVRVSRTTERKDRR